MQVDRQQGIWRFASFLPLDNLAHAVSLGEGNTPLIKSHHLGPALNLNELHFKVEGANPTGSYKDRVAAVGISRLLELKKEAWAATSSGNAGAAIAAYGNRAGIDGYLFTLEKASRAKISQILAYGPQVMAVKGLGYDPAVEKATWSNIQRVCDERNWMMLVTARAYSPQAMDGVKTISFEICEQFVPDVVVVPVGGGGLLSTLWQGFKDWHAAGLIDRLPRMVAVQAQGCDPITQAWKAKAPLKPIPTCESSISGIQLTAPPDGDLVLAALKESNGWAISIPDDETYAAQAMLAQKEGIFVEPASAITLAAVQHEVANGNLKSNASIVCILTGTGFKDAAAVNRMVEHKPIDMIKAEDILSYGSTR